MQPILCINVIQCCTSPFRLAKYSDQNKMTEKNIAIAFGPTLMQTESEVK